FCPPGLCPAVRASTRDGTECLTPPRCGEVGVTFRARTPEIRSSIVDAANSHDAGAQNAGRRHRVVIIGSGFGGLGPGHALAKSDADVTLVAKAGHHLFQPLLYHVATGILSVGDIAPSPRLILREHKNITVTLGDVDRIDVAGRMVHAVA